MMLNNAVSLDPNLRMQCSDETRLVALSFSRLADK